MAKKAKFTPYPKELKDKLIAKVLAGMSPEDVAAEGHGPSGQSIRNWVAKAARNGTSVPIASRVMTTGGMAPQELRDEVARLRKIVSAMWLETTALRQLLELSDTRQQLGITTSPFELLGALPE